MNKNIFYFCATILIAMSPTAVVHASSTATTVNKLPTGIQEITLTQGVSTWFSLPLSEQTVYAGAVTGVTNSVISVTPTSASLTTYAGSATPCFVQFLSGQEAGRTMLITASTSSSLTLDTTDEGIGSKVPLTESGFSVAVGDTFEVFSGDTLATVFGANTSTNPLLLTGANKQGNADQVSLWGTSDTVYYFNTKANQWETTGSTANANNTVIYPYQAISVYRQPGSNATLLLTGQVTPINACQKVVYDTNVYGSTHYATPVTLGQLKMAANWQTGSSGTTADDLAVWSATANAFTFYYQQPNGNWYLGSGSSTAVQNSVVIPAGGVTVVYKRSATPKGAQSYLVSALPYSVD